jgi:predicted RNase H-like nuclease (RuvC/YqgF family)
MAKSKEKVMKISDKLSKVNEEITIKMYDNGFMFEISGRNSDDDWKNAKIIVSTVEELVALINEAAVMDRD